jgi:polyhydroxyalkanoate synthesis repressor PhaR
MRLIKKYPNRRLYDTEESRYITLEELAVAVQGGVDVQVIDAHSQADLTAPTLAQILLESRGGARLLPTPLLLQLVRMRDEALAEFFGKYLSFALDVYAGAKRRAETISPLAPLATVPFSAGNALARLLLSGISMVAPNSAEPAPPLDWRTDWRDAPGGSPQSYGAALADAAGLNAMWGREGGVPITPATPAGPLPGTVPSAAPGAGATPPGDPVESLRRELAELRHELRQRNAAPVAPVAAQAPSGAKPRRAPARPGPRRSGPR